MVFKMPRRELAAELHVQGRAAVPIKIVYEDTGGLTRKMRHAVALALAYLDATGDYDDRDAFIRHYETHAKQPENGGHNGLERSGARVAWEAVTMAKFLDFEMQLPAGARAHPGHQGSFQAHQAKIGSVLRDNEHLRYGLLCHATGTGKTCTMMAAIHGLNSRKCRPLRRFLFVVPNTDIMQQVVDSLRGKCSGVADMAYTTVANRGGKWVGIEWASGQATSTTSCRAVFLTKASLNDLSKVDLDATGAWKSKSETCVLVDEAHEFFTNSSVPRQLKAALAARNRAPVLVSDKTADQSILFLSGVAFALASTATPVRNGPNDMSAYFDCLHYMTAPSGNVRHAVGNIGGTDDEPSTWDRLESAWRTHLAQTGGFVSVFEAPTDDGRTARANYSRAPIGGNGSGDWKSRVVTVPVDDPGVLQGLKKLQTGKDGSLVSMSAVAVRQAEALTSPLKMDSLFSTADRAFASGQGPIMIYSKSLQAGVDVVRSHMVAKRGARELGGQGHLDAFVRWVAAKGADIDREVAALKANGAGHAGRASACPRYFEARDADATEAFVANAVARVIAGLARAAPDSPPPLDPLAVMRPHATYVCKLAALVAYVESQVAPSPGLSRPDLFFVVTGDTPDARRKVFLRAFNSPANHDGSLVKYVVMSNAGATGIDYKNIKQVHLLDVDFVPFFVTQAIGRSTRLGALGAAVNAASKAGANKDALRVANTVRVFAYAAVIDRDRVAPEFARIATPDEATYSALASKHANVTRTQDALARMSVESGFVPLDLPGATAAGTECVRFSERVKPPRIVRPRSQDAKNGDTKAKTKKRSREADGSNGPTARKRPTIRAPGKSANASVRRAMGLGALRSGSAPPAKRFFSGLSSGGLPGATLLATADGSRRLTVAAASVL